jgi:hypothetical protein
MKPGNHSPEKDMRTGIKESPDRFKRFIDFATLMILIIGLGLGLDQANKLTKSIETSNRSNNLSTWSTVSSQGMEIDKVFIEQPEFQKYFFSGATIDRRDTNFEKASAISIMLLDYIDSVLVFLNYLPSEGDSRKETFIERDTWDRYFASLFRNSPLLCQTLEENKGVYGRQTLKMGRSACLAVKAPTSR